MTTVEDIMLQKGSDVIATLPATTIRQAVRKMVEANVGCLLVEDDGRIVGVFTERDLLRRVVDAGKDPDATTVRDVMSSPVRTCTPSDDVAACADILLASHIRHLVVLDRDEAVGVISLRDLPPHLRKPH